MYNTLDKKVIDNINLTNLSSYINASEFRTYFLKSSGDEHYKILAYFSEKYNNSLLLDIGTYIGCSALALSYNQSNKVVSFDIVNKRNLNNHPSNIQFIIDNVLDLKYLDTIKQAAFICLDIGHDGVVEQQFHNLLREIKWKGVLFLDDIHLNDEMKKYWNSIYEEKYDITEYGHFSGSGLVVF